jgi:hypothetical protein
MNFDHYSDWWIVHFIEADCCTRIGMKMTYPRKTLPVRTGVLS